MLAFLKLQEPIRMLLRLNVLALRMEVNVYYLDNIRFNSIYFELVFSMIGVLFKNRKYNLLFSFLFPFFCLHFQNACKMVMGH